MLLTLNGHHTANEEEGHEPQSNFLLVSEELSSLRAIPILLTIKRYTKTDHLLTVFFSFFLFFGQVLMVHVLNFGGVCVLNCHL